MREKIAEIIYVECNQLSPAGEECLCDRPIEAANEILSLIATEIEEMENPVPSDDLTPHGAVEIFRQQVLKKLKGE